jgi:hypothetical protein
MAPPGRAPGTGAAGLVSWASKLNDKVTVAKQINKLVSIFIDTFDSLSAPNIQVKMRG